MFVLQLRKYNPNPDYGKRSNGFLYEESTILMDKTLEFRVRNGYLAIGGYERAGKRRGEVRKGLFIRLLFSPTLSSRFRFFTTSGRVFSFFWRGGVPYNGGVRSRKRTQTA